MAEVGRVYVSSVSYSLPHVNETSDLDLTRTTGVGVTFPLLENTTGLYDRNNKPLYQITINFNSAGVDSLSSIIVNSDSNVNQFSVEFFVPTNPNEPVKNSSDLPLTYTSSIINSQVSIVNFGEDVPSPLIGVRISVLSTTNNQ